MSEELKVIDHAETLDAVVQEEPITVGQSNALPFVPGWTCNQRDDRYLHATDEKFIRKSLENLYIVVNPGGKVEVSPEIAAKKAKLIDMINALAVELLGGVPETILTM